MDANPSQRVWVVLLRDILDKKRKSQKNKGQESSLWRQRRNKQIRRVGSGEEDVEEKEGRRRAIRYRCGDEC